MKIFLSGLEASPEFNYINKKIQKYEYNLMSFYYLSKNDYYKDILKKSKEILIDSGAHSFQKGKKVKWEEYTKEYAKWIKKNDNSKILGYFEMDIDIVIGYKKVLELRNILLNATNKIIPVWHKNRGIENYIDMCKNYKFDIIAITGFKNEDIKDDQYQYFVNIAHKYNKKIHCLGMTRKKILNTVNFDFVDSSSWKQQAIFGRIGNKKVNKQFSKEKREHVLYISYLEAMKMQKKYINMSEV